MKIKFTGRISSKSSSCGCSGGGSVGYKKNYTTFSLPSGVSKTFVARKVTEVSNDDGEFLLSTQDAEFEKVE